MKELLNERLLTRLDYNMLFWHYWFWVSENSYLNVHNLKWLMYVYNMSSYIIMRQVLYLAKNSSVKYLLLILDTNQSMLSILDLLAARRFTTQGLEVTHHQSPTAAYVVYMECWFLKPAATIVSNSTSQCSKQYYIPFWKY